VTARLRAEGVVVRYGRETALKGVSLAVNEGELAAVVGPNGSGKSTLLRALLGAQPCTEGRVELDGVSIDAIPMSARARVVTVVAHAHLPDFALRVRDVVALGRIPHEGLFGGSRPADAVAVDGAMSATDTAALAHRTLGTLSSGELQRVHLARAFAQQTPIVLLDEPTANLDPQHQLTTMRLLRAFVDGGGTAMVVLHDLTLAARHCDRLVVLDQGRVCADGAPSTALAEALLADVFHVRGRIERDADGAVDHVLAIETIEPTAPTGGPS
jgi:iron complex transport system ATP-binding protein